MLKWLILLVAGVTIISAIDISSCNVTKICIINPVGCSTKHPACLVFTYSWNSSRNNFNMEISGGKGNSHQYAGVAFSPDGKMQNSDLYYCTGDSLKSGVIQKHYDTPATNPALPKNITNVKAQTVDGVAMCSFTRTGSITKNVSGNMTNFNLRSSSYYILQAFGNITNGTIQKHSGKNIGRFSSGPFKFTSKSSDLTIDVSSCNKTKICLINPVGCSLKDPTCLVFTYSWDSTQNKFNMEISGGKGNSHQYAGVAFSPDGTMQNSDLYYCTGDNLKSGVIQKHYHTPATNSALPKNITNVKAQTVDGVAMCSFTRTGSITKNVSGNMTNFNLRSSSYYILQAFGNITNGTIQKHSGKKVGRFSSGPFNFTSNPADVTIDVSSCNNTKTCIINPVGCSPKDPTCLVFTYSWDSTQNNFNMEISGGKGNSHQYAGVAFSPDGTMQNSDLYYCTGDNLKSGVIQKHYHTPATDPTLPKNITNVKAQTVDGVAMCSFTRTGSVTKNVSGNMTNFNLRSSSYYILQAFGNITNGIIQKHSGKNMGRFSNGPFNLTSSSDSAQTTTPLPHTTPNPNNNITADCGVRKGCFWSPESCVPGTSSCMFLSWVYISSVNMFDFEIISGATDQYAAIAFGMTGAMQNADVYYCTSNKFFSGVIQDKEKPPVISSSLPMGISNIEHSVVDGTLTCKFRRPSAVSKIVSSGVYHDFNLVKSNYYLLYAVGSAGKNGSLTYHGKTRTLSEAPMNFTQAHAASSNIASLNINLVKVHAIVMLIAWITCVNIGVFVSRHFKLMWRQHSTFKKKIWFQVHRALMLSALLCTIVGFIVIFVAKMGYSSEAGAHPILGILVTALVIINPIMAGCRPDPAAQKRPLFNWLHWFVGSLARVFSIATIFLGVNLSVIDLPSWFNWLLIGFVALHLVTEVALELVSAEYGHIPTYLSLKRETIEVDRQLLISVSLSGETTKNAMLVAYSLLNLAITATLIGFIVVN